MDLGDSSNFTQKTWEEFDDLTKTDRNLSQWKLGFNRKIEHVYYIGVSAKNYVDLTNNNGILARCTNTENILTSKNGD